jgi:hypothetical protein
LLAEGIKAGGNFSGRREWEEESEEGGGKKGKKNAVREDYI